MTSEPDEYEALRGEVCNALFPYGKAFSPPERQAAASVLRDHVEAKLAEVRAERDGFAADLREARKMRVQVKGLQNTVADRDRTIAHLKARLERTDPNFDSDDLDGISCRNDTINLQDERIERMSRTIAEQAAGLERLQATKSGSRSLTRPKVDYQPNGFSNP